MNTRSYALISETTTLDQSPQRRISLDAEVCEEQAPARKPAVNARFSLHLVQERPSPWSLSGAKRLFDVLSVLTVLPLLAPIFLAVALAVRLTSSGPVLFLQKRTGCHGRTFTILKFRTMTHSVDAAHHAVTTTENQRFTPVGPFLRRWKLDELPQLLNVLVGDMSLVGARPKLPEHQVADLQCRPGITGAATVAFAHEAIVLAQVPKHHLDDYYREVVLPTKHQMDVEYMARATFLSDLKLLVNTLLCRWDRSACDSLINNRAFGAGVSREPIPIAFSIDV